MTRHLYVGACTAAWGIVCASIGITNGWHFLSVLALCIVGVPILAAASLYIERNWR